MRSPAPITTVLELALNRFLALDPEAKPRLAEIEGRVLRIEVLGLGLELFLLPGDGAIRVRGDYDGTVDTTLRATPVALAGIGMSEKPENRLFAGEVMIDGDVELGRRFQALLRDVELDWEEQLSRLVGDVAAHQIGNTVRSTLGWGRRVVDTLGRDLAEFLHYERNDLPSPHEVQGFLSEVDTLRVDADRLSARVRRLESTLAAEAPKKSTSGARRTRKRSA